jgi:hypothetical protein
MANIVLFDIKRGDVTLTAAVLARIQAGTLTLFLLTENGEMKFDAVEANAVIAGTKTLRVLHSVHGHRALNAAALAGLT